MRTRPTRLDSSLSRSWMAGLAAIAALSVSAHALPASAEESVPVAQQIVSTGIDMTVVRPLAALRAGIGAVLFVPAAILASPACAVNAINGEDCGPVFEAPYEVLVGEPVEYAFNRKLGEL